MERFGRFTILEPLAQGPIRSYRAWDATAKQVVVLHLGWAAEADIPALAANAIREKGRSEDQVYLVTPDLPEFQDLNSSASVSAGGAFTRMFQQFQAPASEASPKAAAALDPDATQMMPAPAAPASEAVLKEKPRVPKIEAQVIRVGPSRPKAADQISNPALSVKPAAAPGEFTRLFQTPQKLEPPPPAPPAKLPESSPGAFTRMFSQPVGNEPAPQPVRPAPVENKANDFERMFQSPLAGTGREIDFQALQKNAPPPSAPVPKPAGEFTQMFGKPLSSDPAPPQVVRASAQNANATVLFETPAAAPRAASSNTTGASQPSEFTQMFGRPAAAPPSSAGAAAKPPASPAAPVKPAAKAPMGALILIGAALIAIVILVVLFLLLRR